MEHNFKIIWGIYSDAARERKKQIKYDATKILLNSYNMGKI